MIPMNSPSPHPASSNLQNLRERLALLKLEEESQKKEFPLTSLLRLYTQCPRELYIQHFVGLKLLINWLQPISESTFQPIKIPTHLLTYEMQEIANLTSSHISQIYQEFQAIYTQDKESNHEPSYEANAANQNTQ